jgi:hypothetical protein
MGMEIGHYYPFCIIFMAFFFRMILAPEQIFKITS